MGEREVKLDLATTWLKAPSVWALAVFLISGTMLYSRMNTAIEQLQGGQNTIVSSVGEMRDDLRKLVSEHVAQRQFIAWVALFQALNKDLKVPELPR